MDTIAILFFGSTGDSVLVAQALLGSTLGTKKATIAACVTQPPRPSGRHSAPVPTPVSSWAEERNIPVMSFPAADGKPWLFADETDVADSLTALPYDIALSASFGQKIPHQVIAKSIHGGVNIHPSLLPRWRGADPVPWAILEGDTTTGVSLITLAEKFDEGGIIAQQPYAIGPDALPDPVRTELFRIGAQLALESLPGYLDGSITPAVQTAGDHPYARRLKREDGYEPWETLEKAMTTDASESRRIHRKVRAFTPWPGVFTMVRTGSDTAPQRMKIIQAAIDASGLLSLVLVQLEGKKPTTYTTLIRDRTFQAP